jgi:hypothetical protein
LENNGFNTRIRKRLKDDRYPRTLPQRTLERGKTDTNTNKYYKKGKSPGV